MPRRRKRIIDPKFHEFLTEILSNLSAAQKTMLNDREAKKLRSATARQAFINNASETEIDIILTKVGVECTRVYLYHDYLDPELVQNTYRQYAVKDLAGENISEMLENRVFVTDNRPLAISLSMMSLNCHSLAYQFNDAFLKTTRKLIPVRQKKHETNVNKLFYQYLEGYQWARKLLLAGLSLPDHVQGRWDLTPAELTILLLVAEYPNNYVTINYLKRHSTYSPAVVQKTCGILFREKRCIDKLPSKQDAPSYRITAAGILVVGTLINDAVGFTETTKEEK